jgi:hypothetical protein
MIKKFKNIKHQFKIIFLMTPFKTRFKRGFKEFFFSNLITGNLITIPCSEK